LSEVLEKIEYNQVTHFMGKDGLLPKNQHGFRAGRSTLSALASIQQEWAVNSASKYITGSMKT
jgi:hypothetical protein